MFGISWGGFNALQVAALQPPALKAIVTLCSTDDRYADDVHYMGGAKLASADLGWGGFFFGDMCHPPDPLSGRRALARDVAEAPGGRAAVPRALAETPAARRLLAARLGVRGFQRDQMSGLRRRRLDRRLHQRHPAPAGAISTCRARD